jgi:hypothetical protein
LYSVWSSIFGKIETFEATRVGWAGADNNPGAVVGAAQNIPMQFQGHWDKSPGCKPDSESEVEMDVTSNKINYYEVACRLKKVISADAHHFAGTFECFEGGDDFTEQLTLQVDQGMIIGGGMRYQQHEPLFRCK